MESSKITFSTKSKISNYILEVRNTFLYIILIHIYSVRVLFIFDDHFKNAFDGEDGKSADEHMEEVIRIIKNAFKDPTLKREIGTVVNIIGTKVIKSM